MPILYAQKLQEILHQQGSRLEIFTTPEDQKKFQQHFKEQGLSSKPIYSGGIDAAYVEIKTEDLLIVKSELEKMGFPVVANKADGDFRPEYLCVMCKYKSDDPGVCPTHKIKLLEFSEWVEEKSKPNPVSGYIKYIGIVVILSIIAWVYFLNFKMSDHFLYFHIR